MTRDFFEKGGTRNLKKSFRGKKEGKIMDRYMEGGKVD